MSHAQPTTKRNRIGGPLATIQEDSSDAEIQDLGNRSNSDRSDDEAHDNSAESPENSAENSAPSTSGPSTQSRAKAQKRAQPVAAKPSQKPATRSSTRLAVPESAASQGPSGKDEAGHTAKKKGNAQRATKAPVRQVEEEDSLAPEDHDERLLRKRSMEAMEQRVLATLRAEVQKEQQGQALSSGAQVPSSVTKALYSIVALKEKEFEIWLSHVEDAFRGAGMTAMFRASAVRSDNLADQHDIQEILDYPLSWKNAAWTALRQAIGGDSTAYAMSMSVRGGDVLALLRAEGSDPHFSCGLP